MWPLRDKVAIGEDRIRLGEVVVDQRLNQCELALVEVAAKRRKRLAFFSQRADLASTDAAGRKKTQGVTNARLEGEGLGCHSGLHRGAECELRGQCDRRAGAHEGRGKQQRRRIVTPPSLSL